MLYLIGLGLNQRGISLQGLKAIEKCNKIYLENYTVDFPYGQKELKKIIKKKINLADREKVESLEIIKEAKKENIALLIYGSPLTATTHITLVEEAKKNNLKIKVIYSGSIFDAIAETGLQLYKFGKIASMPKWKKSFKPTSFIDKIKENLSINAHSLILIDISLDFKQAIEQLKESLRKEKIKFEKIILCSMLGTKNQKIYYKKINELKDEKISFPYCFIIPSELHFTEREFLKNFV